MQISSWTPCIFNIPNKTVFIWSMSFKVRNTMNNLEACKPQWSFLGNIFYNCDIPLKVQRSCSFHVLHWVIPVIKRFVFKTRCYTILWHLWQQKKRHIVCSPDVVCCPACSINMCLQKWRLSHNLWDLNDCITSSFGKQQQKGSLQQEEKVQSLVRGYKKICRQRSWNFMSALMKFLYLYKLPVAEDFPEQDVDWRVTYA